MPRLIAALIAALVLTPTALAADFDLIVKKVTRPPKTVAAGDDFIVKAKVKNVADEASSGKVTMLLDGGSKPYDLPRRIARFATGKIDAGFFKRYTVRLTVPPDQGAGRYVLQTCVKVKGRPLFCQASKRFKVTAPN